ncbi:MAG: ECF transporter S component [Erysipelotrichia bacterium]|nr:ECF transporter S component [Erysipelotrichia bacterium]
METKGNRSIRKMAYIAIFAALSYAVFTFLQFKIPLPGGDATSIHLGNAVVVIGALLLGGLPGGMAGAIGMTIGDLFDPIYVVYAPKTFICKLCIGLITGLVAEKVGKLDEQKDPKQIMKWTVISSACGLIFNVIADPLIGYFYKLVILGRSMADVTLAWNVGASAINAGISIVVASLVYIKLRPYASHMGFKKSIGD